MLAETRLRRLLLLAGPGAIDENIDMPKAAESALTTEAAEPDYRFTLANERTFLAWQRTSLGLLAAGLGALHFLTGDSDAAIGYILGGGLGVLATATSIGGLSHWYRSDKAIRDGAPLPASPLPVVLTAALAVVGVAVVVAVLVTVA